MGIVAARSHVRTQVAWLLQSRRIDSNSVWVRERRWCPDSRWMQRSPLWQALKRAGVPGSAIRLLCRRIRSFCVFLVQSSKSALPRNSPKPNAVRFVRNAHTPPTPRAHIWYVKDRGQDNAMPIGVHAGRRSADVSLTLEMGSSALLCFVRRSAVWSPDKFLRSSIL